MLETLLKNKNTFLEYNKYRLKKAFVLSPKKAALVFRALPFLLQVNFKGFPGYIDDPDTPRGIKLFRLSQKSRQALQTLFPGIPPNIYDDPGVRAKKAFIHSFLLMGSIGTIAQADKSDFDFWVCVQEDLKNPAQTELFCQKLRLIEEWAEKEHEVEVHFFSMDIRKVQESNFGESDKESAGSSQAKLLKEEFYRTMILVMGKIPIWWIIPPGVDDQEYQKLKSFIASHEELGKNNFTDLGNLYQISYEEFFGAALWQMNKAMDSPFKSVLKMGMLEGYIGTEGNPALLCTELKRKVFLTEKGRATADPYRTMFNHILRYYKSIGNEEVLDLLCKCFYIKINVKANLEMLDDKSLNFKEKALINYINRWEWEQDTLDDLNNYKDWNFNKVLKLGGEVHSYMVKTYQSLADRLKEGPSEKQIITESDLTILGRKLFTFYSKKPNKIENLRKAFDDGLIQDDLTFHASYDKSRRIVWSLYRGQFARATIDEQDLNHKLIKKHSDLIYTIIWMVYNKICDLKTHLYLTPNPTEVVLADIQRLVKEIYEFFPDFKISTLKNQDLLSSAKKKKVYMLLNFFSERTKSEIESASMFYLTTWGELFFESFDEPKAGVEKFCEYIKEHHAKDVTKLPSYFRVFVPKGQQSEKLSRNVHSSISKKTGPVPRFDK